MERILGAFGKLGNPLHHHKPPKLEGHSDGIRQSDMRSFLA